MVSGLAVDDRGRELLASGAVLPDAPFSVPASTTVAVTGRGPLPEAFSRAVGVARLRGAGNASGAALLTTTAGASADLVVELGADGTARIVHASGPAADCAPRTFLPGFLTADVHAAAVGRGGEVGARPAARPAGERRPRGTVPPRPGRPGRHRPGRGRPARRRRRHDRQRQERAAHRVGARTRGGASARAPRAPPRRLQGRRDLRPARGAAARRRRRHGPRRGGGGARGREPRRRAAPPGAGRARRGRPGHHRDRAAAARGRRRRVPRARRRARRSSQRCSATSRLGAGRSACTSCSARSDPAGSVRDEVLANCSDPDQPARAGRGRQPRGRRHGRGRAARTGAGRRRDPPHRPRGPRARRRGHRRCGARRRCCELVAASSGPAAAPPWLPPLPARLPLDVAARAAARRSSRSGSRTCRTSSVSRCSRGTRSRQPRLLVVGDPGTGRSTALAAVARGLGVAPLPADPAALWDRLAEPASPLLVDDIDHLLDRLGEAHRAAAIERLAIRLRDPSAAATVVTVRGPSAWAGLPLRAVTGTVRRDSCCSRSVSTTTSRSAAPAAPGPHAPCRDADGARAPGCSSRSRLRVLAAPGARVTAPSRTGRSHS